MARMGSLPANRRVGPAIALGLVLAWAPTAPAEPDAKPVIRAPYIGAGGQVVVPYTAHTPTFRVDDVAGTPYRVFLDFDDVAPEHEGTRSGSFNNALFKSWRVGIPRPKTLRLTVSLAKTAPVEVEVRPDLKQLWLVPQGAVIPTPKATAKPTVKPTIRPTPRPRSSRIPIRTAPTPEPANGSTSVNTRIGRVHFDAVRQALVLPFDGGTPGYYMDPAPPEAVFMELPHAVLALPGTHDQTLGNNPVIARWTIRTAEPEKSVRLTLDMPGPGHVLVTIDRNHHELLLFPQPTGKVLDGGAAPRAIMGLAGYDKAADVLFLPYYGTAPTPVIERISDQTWYVTMPEVALKPLGAQYGTVPGHPLLGSWLLARLPKANLARLAVTLAYPGHLEVKDDPVAKRLVIAPRLGPPVP
ncbi:MAG: hypothetical protein JWM80_3851 [Cyanobacteria bacterium RYN_339]|nr:hypothetical protein [Cyanobacteria bacterium RYN_339]